MAPLCAALITYLCFVVACGQHIVVYAVLIFVQVSSMVCPVWLNTPNPPPFEVPLLFFGGSHRNYNICSCSKLHSKFDKVVMLGNSSGETKAADKKRLHHLNPRRRNKWKQKLPDEPLPEEEKHRRAEQKKRRVTTAAAVAGLCLGGCCGFSSALEDVNASILHTLVFDTHVTVLIACAVATQAAAAAAQAASDNCRQQLLPRPQTL